MKAVPLGVIGMWIAFSEACVTQMLSKLNARQTSLKSYLKRLSGTLAVLSGILLPTKMQVNAP